MKVLITGAWNASKEQIQRISDLGYEVTFLADEKGTLPDDCAAYDGVICNGLFLYHDVARFPGLKFVQLTSAGTDRVPVDAISQKGVRLYTAAGVYSIPISEHVLACVLSHYRALPYFAGNQKNKMWIKKRDLPELNRKRVCIIGCGKIGVECAKRFSAFGCTVRGVDTILDERPFFEEIVSPAGLQSELKAADIVLLSLPLTPDTVHFFGREQIGLLKKDAVLVNICRGGVLDMDALCERVCRGELYAILDVFEEEPLAADDPLWTRENVTITPHNSFIGDGNADRLFDVIYQNLLTESL